MAAFDRGQKRFNCKGLDLNNPVDHVREDHYPFLQNVRSLIDGTIQARNGHTLLYTVAAGQSPIRAIRRLNKPRLSQWARLVQSGTVLAAERSGAAGATINIVTGLSGNPVSLIPWRPNQSPDPWMYVADSNTMRKLHLADNGTTVDNHQVGYDAPGTGSAVTTGLPSAAVATPSYKEIDYIEYANNAALQAAWSVVADGVNAQAIVALPVLSPGGARVSATTITAIVYDIGTTGWCCIQPSATGLTGLGAITPGAVLTIGAEAGIVATEVHRAAGASVCNLGYENSAGTGPGTFWVSNSSSLPLNVEVGAMVSINDGVNPVANCRVMEVRTGQDGRNAFRSAHPTIALISGAVTVTTLPSFRCYTVNNHVGGGIEAIASVAMRLTMPAAGGVGYATRAGALDLSAFATGPVREEDWGFVTFRVDDTVNLTSLRLMFDVDSVVGTYNKNFYWLEVRPSDLTQAVKNRQSLIDARVLINRRLQLDGNGGKSPILKFFDPEHLPDNPSQPDADPYQPPTAPGVGSTPAGSSPAGPQTASGDSQWTTIWFRIQDLQRTGSDSSRSLANVGSVRVQVTAGASAGINIDVDGIGLGGGFGPDSFFGGADVYHYRYRARCSSTGAVSPWSPATLNPVNPRRTAVTVTVPQYTAAAEIDKLDIERFGGSLLGWHYLGTVNNGTTTFNDDYPDDLIKANPDEDDQYRPWPILGVPVAGSTGAFSSGALVRSAGLFDPAWAPGTLFIANGIAGVIQTVFSANSLLLFQPIPNVAVAAFEVPEPMKLGQPLPGLAGPFNGFMLGWGDLTNPGRMYFTTQNNPDGCRLPTFTSSISFYVDLTPPSEPLLSIVIYNGKAFAFTAERMMQILIDPSSPNVFYAADVPNGRGLFSKWAIAVGDFIYFLSRDGIYASDGSGAISITKDKLQPLFPQEGVAPDPTTLPFSPPAMTQAAAADLRLSYCLGRYLYFDFKSVAGAVVTLLMDVKEGNWYYDTYGFGNGVLHYMEEGGADQHDPLVLVGSGIGTDSKLYKVGGTITDAGASFLCTVVTPSMDMGDPRSRKLFGDLSVEVNAAGASISASPGFDNRTVIPAATVLPTSTGRLQSVIDLTSGNGVRAKNISLQMQWLIASTEVPVLYFWEPSWINKPEDIIKRATDYDGTPTPKWYRGVTIEADTFGQDKVMQLRIDGGITPIPDFTINHNGKSRRYYAFPTQFFAYDISLLYTDSNLGNNFEFEFDAQDAPPGTTLYTTAPMDHGAPGWQQLIDGYLTLISFDTVTLQCVIDGTTYTAVFPNADTNTGGLLRKVYFRFPSNKGKSFQYSLSAPTSIRPFDLEVNLRPWGAGKLLMANPIRQEYREA